MSIFFPGGGGFVEVAGGESFGGGGSSFLCWGENMLGDSGEEAGDAGDAKVFTAGARTSPFWYSGVGGLFTAGALSSDRDCIDCWPTKLIVGLGPLTARDPLDWAVFGRTLRPGRPPTEGGFRRVACELDGSSWMAVDGRWVEAVDEDMMEEAPDTVEPWLWSSLRPEISRLSF